MSRKSVGISDLKDVVPDDYDVQVWIDAGVIEISIGEKSSIDIELEVTDMGDEYSNAYIAEHNIKSLFYVTFKAEDYNTARALLKNIATSLDAFVCGDTEDFTPVM